MKRRTLLASAGAAACALTAASCGLAGEESATTAPAGAASGPLKGEIVFQTWSLKNERFSPYFEKLIKDFETAHPGTKITWMDQPGEGYEEKVLQQANSGSLPDVVNLPPDFAYQLSKAKKIVDISSVHPNPEKTWVPGGLKAYQFEGVEGTYGYPWYLGTDMNVFNTKALKDAGIQQPTNWDEMVTASKELAKNTGGRMMLISNMPELDAFKAKGVALMKDGKFSFNQPAAAQVLQQYVDLYQAKAIPAEVLQNNYAGNTALYKQGKVAWTTGTASLLSDLQKEAPNLVPVTAVSARFGTAPLFVQGISLAAGSKNPALAQAFAEFVVNNENQVAFVKIAQGFMPGTVEANAHPDSFTGAIKDKQMAAAVKIAASQMPTAEMLAPVQYSNDMRTYTGQQFGLAMRGDISAKDALDKAVEYCNRKLI